MFTCGAPLQELHLAGKLADVYVKDISCEDPTERLYYEAKYPPICVYCACCMPEVMLQLSIIRSVLSAHKTQHTEIRTMSSTFLASKYFLCLCLLLSTFFVPVFTSKNFLLSFCISF